MPLESSALYTASLLQRFLRRGKKRWAANTGQETGFSPEPLSHVALGGAPAPPPYRRAVCRSPFGEISRLGPRPREACNLRVSASRPRDPAPNPSGAERPGDARCQLPLEGRPAGPRNFSPETGPGNRSEVGSGGAEPGGSR